MCRVYKSIAVPNFRAIWSNIAEIQRFMVFMKVAVCHLFLENFQFFSW